MSSPWGHLGREDTTAAYGHHPLGYDTNPNPYLGYGDPRRSHDPLGFRPPSRAPVFVDDDSVSRFEDPSVVDPDLFDDDTLDNFRGVDLHAISQEAQTILFKYMGDLYRGNQEPTGAGSASGERSSAASSYGGIFSDAHRPSPGIRLPSDFSEEFKRLDEFPTLRPVPVRSSRSFLFSDPDNSRFFGKKDFSPDTLAFASSLRAPGTVPLLSKDFRRADTAWKFINEASSLTARLAVYSVALSDIVIRADELEVSREDRDTINALILEIAALSYAQALRMNLHATSERRNAVLDALPIPKDCPSRSAATRLPRDGEFVFAGKFLEAVDADLAVQKRAKEVAAKYSAKPSRFSPYSRRRPPATSSLAGRQPFRSRFRGSAQRRPARGRGRGAAPFTASAPPPFGRGQSK